MAPRDNFGEFEATSLFCPRCRRATQTRKRLLLVLPDGSKERYSKRSGASLGSISPPKSKKKAAATGS